jgi:hypothetical protein
MGEQTRSQPNDFLWRDYAFLTTEMAKFAARQEWDMLLNLLEQRAVLQQRIDEQTDREFIASSEGKSLLQEIFTEEQRIARTLRESRNEAQTWHKVARAYDSFSDIPTGSLMNRGS